MNLTNMIGFCIVIILCALGSILYQLYSPQSRTNTKQETTVSGPILSFEGCTVYRFSDKGVDHYWVQCKEGNDVKLLRNKRG